MAFEPQQASISGTLRTVLTVILVWYIVKYAVRLIRSMRQPGSMTHRHGPNIPGARKPGEMHIEPTHGRNGPTHVPDAEYVEFEEVH